MIDNRRNRENMKFITLCICLVFAFTTANAQFKVSEKGLTIIVTDGTDKGRHSKVSEGNDIPSSYEYIGGDKGKGKQGRHSAKSTSKNQMVFTDPIRELGMTDCIQAAAFLERPKYGLTGFMLIFSINDSIGGKQATLVRDGKTYKGVYRIVKQRTSSDEAIPKGMTTYQVEGTFLLLGIS